MQRSETRAEAVAVLHYNKCHIAQPGHADSDRPVALRRFAEREVVAVHGLRDMLRATREHVVEQCDASPVC
jgi:hypothetical protein